MRGYLIGIMPNFCSGPSFVCAAEKGLARLGRCQGSSEPWPLADAIRTKISCVGSFTYPQIMDAVIS